MLPLYSTDYSIQLNTFDTIITELKSYANPENTMILPSLTNINAVLHQVVMTSKAASNVQIEIFNNGQSKATLHQGNQLNINGDKKKPLVNLENEKERFEGLHNFLKCIMY